MLFSLPKFRTKRGPRVGWEVLAGAVSVAGLAAACGSGASPSTIAPGEADAGDKGPVSDAGSTGTFVTTHGDSAAGATVLAAALEFVPAQATLTVDGTTPRTTTFQLQATLANGQTEIVTPTSMEFDRPDLASASLGSPVSVTASGNYGGSGQLHAIFGGREAIATLHVVVAQKSLGTVPSSVATALDQAGVTPSDAALTSIQYPYDKTVFPLGLTAPLVMWNAPSGGAHANDVYRLHLQESSYTYDVYSTTPVTATSPTASSAQWAIDQSIWDRVTASNAGPDDPLQVVLSRYDVETTTAAASAALSWTIAPASLRGAIYYWTASKSTESDGGTTQVGHITRMAPGTGAQPIELNSGRCMGCHAVSADGTTLVAAIDDPATAPAVAPYVLSWQQPPTRPWAAFDVSQATPQAGFQSTEYGADIALTPDGAYTVWGAPTNVLGSKVLSLSNTKTGALVTGSGLDGLLTPLGPDVLSMPAFSPDGTMLAVVRSPTSSDNVLPNDPKAIVYLNYTASSQTFGASINPIVSASDQAIVTGETALAYPSFTPDSQYVAFHAGTQSTGCQEHGAQSWLRRYDGRRRTAVSRAGQRDRRRPTRRDRRSSERVGSQRVDRADLRPDRRWRLLVGRLHEPARLGQHGVARRDRRGRDPERELQTSALGRRHRSKDRRGRPEPPRLLSRRAGQHAEHARILGERPVHQDARGGPNRERVHARLRVLLGVLHGRDVRRRQHPRVPIGRRNLQQRRRLLQRRDGRVLQRGHLLRRRPAVTKGEARSQAGRSAGARESAGVVPRVAPAVDGTGGARCGRLRNRGRARDAGKIERFARATAEDQSRAGAAAVADGNRAVSGSAAPRAEGVEASETCLAVARGGARRARRDGTGARAEQTERDRRPEETGEASWCDAEKP